MTEKTSAKATVDELADDVDATAVAAEPDTEAESESTKPGKPKPRTKAEKLEARAAKLRAAEAAAEARSDAPRRSGRWIVATGVLGALAVGLGVVVGVWVPYVLHQHKLNSTRNAVVKVAQQYAVDFGSYDYQHLDADFQRVATHLTSGFAKSYASVSATLKPTIVQYKGKSTAAVQGVAISSVSTSRAVVLVFLDQTVTTTQQKTARIDRNRLQLTMQRQKNGTWLISNLELK